MTTINIYLTYDGNCEEAFNYYKSVFGGDFSFVGRFKDIPAEEDFIVSPEDREKIMHISLPISKETVLMGSDSENDKKTAFTQGNNFSISISTDSKEKADTFFQKLSEGGQEGMAMHQSFWGSYFGTLTDKFGVHWMVSFDENEQN